MVQKKDKMWDKLLIVGNMEMGLKWTLKIAFSLRSYLVLVKNRFWAHDGTLQKE